MSTCSAYVLTHYFEGLMHSCRALAGEILRTATPPPPPHPTPEIYQFDGTGRNILI